MDFDLPFNVEKKNQARRLELMDLEMQEEEEKRRRKEREKQNLDNLYNDHFESNSKSHDRGRRNSFLTLASREYSSVDDAEYGTRIRNTSPQARNLPQGIKRPNPNVMSRNNYEEAYSSTDGAGHEYAGIPVDSETFDIVNASLLGSQLNWNVPYGRFSGSCCLATFCPCILMGQITTLLKRETPKYQFCKNFNLGTTGIKEIFKTTFLACLCPIPFLWPSLMPESRKIRKRIISMYNIETPTRIQENNSSRWNSKRKTRNAACSCDVDSETLKAYFLPLALSQEYKFLKKRVQTNTLRFPWETKTTWDIRAVEDLPVFKILFMGDNNVGKSILFKRLLGFAFQEEEDIPNEYIEDTTVNIGVRVFHDKERCPLGSLELWDVPAEEYAMVEDQVFEDFHVLVLTFSWLRAQSFHYMKQIVKKIKDLRIKYASKEFSEVMGNRLLDNVPIIICATKVDLFAKASSKFHKEVDDFLEKEGLLLVETSGRTGLGLGKLLKTIVNSLVVVYKVDEDDEENFDFENVSKIPNTIDRRHKNENDTEEQKKIMGKRRSSLNIGVSNPIKPG